MIKNNWKKIVSVLMIAVMFSSGPLSDAAPKSAQIEDAEEESVEAEGEDVETTDIEAEDVETEDSETADDEAETDESEEATDEDAEAAEEETETGENSVTPTTNQYVSEIRLFKGDAARKKGESDGWTIVSDGDEAANLNEVLTPNSPSVYLGYKTTDDESEAIRDVKMLEMDRGYQWFDYQKVAEGQMDKLEPMIADLVKALSEFKKNLADGSKAAEKAKAYLNLLYFTGDYPEGGKTSGEKILLGDYLSSGNVNQQQLKKLIVRMNGGSLLAMFTQLTLALTDTDKSWAERIADADTYKNTKPTSVQRRNWDNSYYEYSMELLPKIQSFAENYRKSVKASGGKGASDELKDAGDELSGDNIQDVLKAGTEISSAGIAYETAYGMMNKYFVGSEQLGDYILHLGDKNYSTRQDYRELYPLVESLTHGQYGMCKVVGIEQLALYLGNTDETYAKMDEERAKIEKTISRLTKGDKHISVWEGVNTEFYDRPVALTSDAYRESKAGADYTELTREGEFYDTMNLIMMGIGLASSACAVITGVIQLGLLIAGSSLGVWAACTAMIGTGFWATFLGVLGVVATVGGTIALIALLVALFVYGVYKLSEYMHRDDAGEYTEMPGEIYDIVEATKGKSKQRSFIKYVPVEGSDGKPQDLNGDDGKRWNLLYYTKNKGVGTPLCVDNEGKAFVRVMDKPDKPEGTVAISCFGEGGPANLNSFARKSGSRNIYLYYITNASLDGTDGTVEEGVDINESDEAKTDERDNINKKKYLYSLIVSRESTESAAKTNIRRKPGYQVLDFNLTPNAKELYTYIGYSLTTVEKDALRDIRIVPNYNQDITYGSANYASAGTFEDGSALVYTRQKEMGSPIYGGLAIRDEILPAEDPLEPVNMLCGGNAFDLHMQSDGGKPIYLYFLPSETYTSGEKYISGIQVVASRKTKESRDRDYLMKYLGLTDYGVELASYQVTPSKDEVSGDTSGIGYGGLAPFYTHYYENYTAHFAYTTTYNPYRAIYDAGIYRATTRIDELQPMMQTPEGVYTCAETVMISDKTELFSEAARCLKVSVTLSENSAYYGTDEAIRVLPHHSWIRPPHTTGRGFLQDFQSLNAEGNVDVIKIGSKEYRLLGLYMIGPGNGRKKPLREEDIVVSTDKTVPAGMHPVKLFTDPYADKVINLGYETLGVDRTPTYMYIRGEKSEKPKYISSIEVVTYKKPEAPKKESDMSSDEKKQYKKMLEKSDNYADDQCRMGLVAKGAGEVYNYNIAANQSETWYKAKDPTAKDYSYIGVSRTDDSNKAITGILLYKSDKVTPHSIKVDGVEYRRAGDMVKGYNLYFTKSPAANPGVPLTDISFDQDVVKKGEATVIAITSSDSEDGSAKASFMAGTGGLGVRMHQKMDTDDAVVSDIMVMQGQKEDAATQLMQQGFNYIIDADFNYNTGFDSGIYVGYKMCGASAIGSVSEDAGVYDDEDGDDEDLSEFDFDFSDVISDEHVVYDVICVREGDGAETITHNGTTYKLVSPISLNEGTDGTSLYMYAAYEDTFIIDGVKTVLNPLSGMSVCSHDAVPGMGDLNNPYGNWELFLDTEGEEVNLNDNVLSVDASGHIQDCRLFMFVHRYESHIKPGAQIERGKYKGEIATAFDQEIFGGIDLLP